MSILLSSIVFVITKLESIAELESIKRYVTKDSLSIAHVQIDEDYLRGVSSSNLQLLSRTHICVEVFSKMN